MSVWINNKEIIIKPEWVLGKLQLKSKAQMSEYIGFCELIVGMVGRRETTGKHQLGQLRIDLQADYSERGVLFRQQLFEMFTRK